MYKLKPDEFIRDGYYCKRIRPDINIHVHLGRVKQKNDGRWEYWLFKDNHNFHKEWNDGIKGKKKQGVCSTESEAWDVLFNVWLNKNK